MKFSSKNTNLFFSDLAEKVDAYFIEKGCDRYANKSIFIKGMLLVFTYWACYILLIAGKHNSPLAVPLLLLMGSTGVMIVFNIVHDASHKVLFRNPAHNRLAAYLGDLMGMNTHIWNLRHNIQHHSFTNIVGGDILLDNIPLVRVSPYQKRFWIHKFQAFYVIILYMVYSVFWVFFLDISFFFKKNMGNLKNIRHTKTEWLALIFFKTLYISYMILIPWIIIEIPFLKVLAGFFIFHAAAGILLSTVVVLGHCVEGPQYVAPDENGMIHNSWMQHEWDTTSDCATRSRLMHWISGGLNTHLAHHLFPRICHCHYYDITGIIRKHCEEYKVVYPHHSFGKAIISHFRFLKMQAKA